MWGGKALWNWRMALPELIMVLMRPVMLLVALRINDSQGCVAGLWVIV